MILNNGNKVIFDSDIIMTNNHSGETLGDVLNSLNEDIKSLKRNVKFLYLYGGVGTHGGSGSGSLFDWKIFATLDNQLLQDGKTISLDGPNTYSLRVQILNVSGISEFNISIQYKNKTGVTNISRLVDLSQSYTWNTSAQLDINDKIIITVTPQSGAEDTKLINTSFITNPYTFLLNFGYDSGLIINETNPIFYLSEILNKGLYTYLTYNIGVDGIYTVYYNDFNGTSHEQTISSDDKEGVLKLLLAEDSFFLDNNNSGFYSVIVNIKIQREGQLNVTVTRKLNCNLIPSTLYLRISPQREDAILYDQVQQDSDNLYKYNLGGNAFLVQVFEGPNEQRNYTLNYSIKFLSDNSITSYDPLYLYEQRVAEVNLSFGKSGWAIITFTVSRGNITYTVNKYVCISSSVQGLDWLKFYEEVVSNKGVTSYKRYFINNSGQGGEDGVEELFSTMFSNLILIQSTSVSEKQIDFVKPSTFSPKEFLLNFTVLLSSINNFENEILSIEDNTGKNVIKVYLNKVLIDNNEITIFIPKYDNISSTNKDHFHLITIYKRFYKHIGYNDYYQYDVYIDGSLEGSGVNFGSNEIFYTKLVYNNINFQTNLFDLIYYGSLMTDVTTNISESIFNDAEITKYFYTYLSKYGLESLNEDKVEIANILERGFVIDSEEDGLDTGMVTLKDSAVLNDLALIESLPSMLVFNITDTQTYGLASIGSQSNFLRWYLWRAENDSDEDTTGSLEVSIEYREKGTKGLLTISLPGDVSFTIKKLGTSTRTWFAKNLTLKLESTSENKLYLFTPNLELTQETDSNEEKKRKYNTFLPELEFTLKKDVVDSAHSNNNAIGDFVNNNTKKFNTGELGIYLNYIKNCLTGFPCLVFVEVNYTDPVTTVRSTKVYYLGYYNFNLGRESYYNLGYKDLSHLTNNLYDVNTNQITNLLSGFKVYYTNQNNFKSGLMVSEIKNNGDYYDFSLYHESILFGLDGTDVTKKMWGDYVPELNATNIKNELQNLVRGVSKAGGYVFDFLGKKLGLLTDKYNAVISDDPESPYYNISNNLVPDYKILYERIRNLSTADISEEPTGAIINKAQRSDLTNAVVSNEEITPILDYESLVDYYTIAMAFAMVDSVEKNMNLKSWNSGKTWYTAFYDMDTALGIDNAGYDVAYRAFSDYWDIINTDNNSNQLKPATIYRDFWPKAKVGDRKNRGFDTPSSYLLAIAKYSKLILGDLLSNSNEYPLSRWCTFRGTDGELRNAEYFIDKYYSSRTDSAGECLLNYNYRTTYLFKCPGEDPLTHNVFGYSGTDFGKFKGNRKYSTRDWLNERLHIMDVYMGIISKSNASKRFVLYLDENNEWKILIDNNQVILDLPVPLNASIFNNNDIIILNDIFSSSGVKYAHLIEVDLKALENSFVSVSSSLNSEFYMILDPDIVYNFKPTYYSNDLTSFGGSDRWTYISDISQFINDTEGGLTVNSTNLLNFTMKAISSLYSAGVSGFMPSVLTINITGKKYIFDLNNINGVFPGVLDINIDDSGVNLTNGNNSTNTSVNSISAQNMECRELKVLNFVNLNNIYISGTFSNSINISPYNKDITLGNINCPNIVLKTRADDISVTINNNTSLVDLELEGYTNIYISACPNLRTIKINDESKVKKLHVVNCSKTSKNLTLNSSEQKIINLENFSSLEEIRFSGGTATTGTAGFTTINFPNKDNCELYSQCFCYCTSLKTLNIPSGKYVYITGPGTFRSTSISTISLLKVKNSVTSLANTFDTIGEGTAGIILSQAEAFINNIDNNNTINNISYMFRGLSTLEYSTNKFSLYSNKTCSLKLNKFSNVTSAQHLFAETKVTFLNKYMFNGFGVEDNTDIYGIFGNLSGKILYCTIDSLEYLLPKLKDNTYFQILFSNPTTTFTESHMNNDNRHTKIRFINNNGSNISDSDAENIYIKNFFLSDSDNKNKIIGFYCLDFDQKYNLDELFYDEETSTVRFESLKYIYYSFNSMKIYGRSGGNPDFTNTGLHHSNVCYIYKSFKNIESTSYIDLLNLLNWSKFSNIPASGNSTINPFSIYSNFYRFGGLNKLLYDCFTGVKKYVNKTDYNSIWDSIRTSSYYKTIGNIFEDTLLISDNNDSIIPDNIITYANELWYTFKNFEIINTAVTNDEEYSSLLISKIPLNIDNIITKFINCTNFIGTFYGVTLYETLPYDFFKRRIENVTNKYTVINDDRVQCEYVYYTYTQAIKNLSYCFSNVKIAGTKYFKYNSNEPLKRNRLRLNNEGNYEDIENTTYYDNSTSEQEQQVMPNYEIIDVTNHIYVDYDTYSYEVGSSGELHFYISNTTPLGLSITLFDDIFFIVPDIFYACTNDCNLLYCFADSEFTGALPEHLLKPNNATLNNWIYNVDILPQYVGLFKKNRTNFNDYYWIPQTILTIVLKVYVFVPENFCKTYSSFENAFNFRTRLPDCIDSITESYDNNEIKSYYIFSNKTFVQLSKLKNSLPSVPKGWENTSMSTEVVYYNYSLRYDSHKEMYYNIMFNEIEEQDGDRYLGKDGLQLYNNNMDTGGLFDWIYLGLGYGYLFNNINKELESYSNPNSTISSNSNTSSNPTIGFRTWGPNRIILPKVKNPLNLVKRVCNLVPGSITVNLSSSQIIDKSTSSLYYNNLAGITVSQS